MPVSQDYWDALDRLKNNNPIRLPNGSKINKNNVALEAGRKIGSIKKSRNIFSELITAIDQTATELKKQNPDLGTKLKNERSQKSHYRELYHQALNRELMLVERLAQLEKQLKSLGNVRPIK